MFTVNTVNELQRHGQASQALFVFYRDSDLSAQDKAALDSAFSVLEESQFPLDDRQYRLLVLELK